MPANTSPDNIIYPVSTDAISPLETVFANMAQSVQDALTGNRTPYANVGALPGSAITGQAALVLTTPGAWWQWDGSDWQMRGVAQFADGTARDSALTSPEVGWRSRLATEDFDREWDGSNWVVPGDDTGWITPTLLNSWSNLGSGYVAARYRRLNGIVYVQGTVTGGTVTSGTNILNLPAGFRSSATMQFPVATTSASGAARIEMAADGNIKTSTGVSASALSFQFSFPAEA